LLLSCLAVLLGCATDDGGADSTTTSNSESTTGDSESSGTETGDPASCDPSDPDIGPAVEVTILNQTEAPLYLTEATGCVPGAPFGISFGGQALDWIFGICDSCGEALQGICQCPGPCFIDTVIRIDAGGQYVGSWPGGSIFQATLTPECADDFCGDQCFAIAQAEDGDYVANAIASAMVTCESGVCDCVEAPDPDGWCRIEGMRAGGDISSEVAFAYPNETAVELSFN
jgi:hypothetical protein